MCHGLGATGCVAEGPKNVFEDKEKQENRADEIEDNGDARIVGIGAVHPEESERREL